MAALLALPVAWFLRPYPWALAGVIVVLSAFGVWGTFHVQNRGWVKDDPRITLDEFCGMLIAVLWMPSSLPSSPSSSSTPVLSLIIIYVIAFVIFRALDIFKPPPLRLIERLPGGWGVMADDLVAGLITNGILRLIMLIPIPLIYGY
jgi:phosphatidylglycerophosphatase A